jgi:hypothetical protein
MFDAVLLKAEIETGTLSQKGYEEFFASKSPENLESIALGILQEMEVPFNFLLSTVRNLYSQKIFSSSKIEKFYSPTFAPSISEIRIRPENSYYARLGKDVPRPENPNGNDATGLEIKLCVLPGFSMQNNTVFPRLWIELMVWGVEERKAFGKLLKNYYRIMELLLGDLEAEFTTACSFERLNKLKSQNPFTQLSTYYQKEDDDENSFLLSRIFTYGESYEDIVRIFLVFSALYDSCLGYLTRTKDFDRILNYYQKLKSI